MVATLRSSSPALRRPLRMLALALVLLGMSALARPADAETEPGLTIPPAPASEAVAAPATEPTAAPAPL